MNRQQIDKALEELIKAVSETADYSSSMDLSDDLGLSSIDVMNLFTACKSRFSVKIPAKQLRTISTPDDLADYIEANMQE